MTFRHEQFRHTAVYAAAVIALAVFCRVVVHTTSSRFLENLANFVRIFLYLGLFSVWGGSIRQRVMQLQVRRYLVAVAALMVFWLTVREFRWHLIQNAGLRRWLWYLYYVPLLLIPLLALLVSMSLGQSGAYRLPPRTKSLYVPTVILILLVLTNDLHQWMFSFPQDAAPEALDYRYGILWYLVSAWIILCSLAAFLMMLGKCRVPRAKKILWLPLLPFGVAVAYAVLYMLRVPFVVNELGDLTVFNCLLFTAFFESCVVCGLIQSNTHYYSLFRASVNSSAQIVDQNYVVRYSSRDALPFLPETMRLAETAPVDLPGGKRLHNMPINGGHVVWSEDVSELLALREKLESVQEELSARNEIVRMEYVQEKEQKTVEEQNRLYDLMQQKTQSQLDQAKRLAVLYGKAESDAERKRILAHIVVLGSYIKRRKDFVLAQQDVSVISERTLENAFGESFRSLELLHIRGAYFVRTGRSHVMPEIFADAYDFFELFLEATLDSAHYLNVHVSAPGGALRCAIESDVTPDTDALLLKYPGLLVSSAENGSTMCILSLEEGGANT